MYGYRVYRRQGLKTCCVSGCKGTPVLHSWWCRKHLEEAENARKGAK